MHRHNKTKAIFILRNLVLVTILQISLASHVSAQNCGAYFPSGGSQDGSYASGGGAKYSTTFVELTGSVSSRWNMVSVPLIVEDYTKDTLFPTSTSSAFTYQNGYAPATALQNRKGYWIKWGSAQSISMSGYPISSDSFPLSTGWNMIGSISEPIATSMLTSVPPGLITSSLYGFEGSYAPADTLRPFKGYWLKASAAGILVLNPTQTPENIRKNAITIQHTGELPPGPPDVLNDMPSHIPMAYGMQQAYPDPFNPTTTIRYELPFESRITLRIYNTVGQIVATLRDGIEEAGYWECTWNAPNLASGVYFYRLEAAAVADPGKTFVQTMKVMLIK